MKRTQQRVLLAGLLAFSLTACSYMPWRNMGGSTPASTSGSSGLGGTGSDKSSSGSSASGGATSSSPGPGSTGSASGSSPTTDGESGSR